MKRKSLPITAILALLALHTITGQTRPDLGATERFALFTAVGAFNELGLYSTVTGDVSTNAGAFAAFPPGTLNGTKILPGSAEAVQAATDVVEAYSDLNQGGTTIAAVVDGLTLTPGVYTVATAASLGANGVLTLDAQGNPEALFIIRIGGAFATGANSSVSLVNAASLSKVFWQINGQFDVGTNATFRGTALVNGAINLLDGATLIGRALSTAGALSLYNNIVSIPSHFRSRVTGNWDAPGTWESSIDSISWGNAYVQPTYDVVSVTVSTGHTVTIAGTAEAPVLSIAPGAHLTLAAAQTLSADLFIINSDITNGAGTYVTDGTTLVAQTKVNQELTAGRNWYLSSPVEAATASSINSSTGTYMAKYDEPHGSTIPWVTETATLTPLKGYVAVSPVTPTPVITFTGDLNDGLQTLALTRTTGQTKEGFNLVGNPYPSHMRWTQAMALSANALPTLWYRTHTGSAYAFHTYNALGEVGVPAATTGIVPPMQAFWVRVNEGGGTLTVDNESRLHDEGSNRLKAPALAIANPLLRLQVTNGIGTGETVVYFNENASPGFDTYDSPIMSNNSSSIPELYTLAGSESVIINGLPAIEYEKELPLGFMTLTANTFQLSAIEITGFEEGTGIFLLDSQLPAVETVLTPGGVYTFSAPVTTASTDRFSLLFRAPGTLTHLDGSVDPDNSAHAEARVMLSASRQLVVEATAPVHVAVYNLMGRKLYDGTLSAPTTTLQTLFERGIYYVTLTLKGEKSVLHKIII